MWVSDLAAQGRDIQEVHGPEQASHVRRALGTGRRLPGVRSSPPPASLLACPEVRPPLSQACHGGHHVLAQTLFHPRLPGRPTHWADMSLADAGVAERSWNRVRRAVGLAWRGALWPGQQASSQAGRRGPGPPPAGLPRL